MKTVFKYHCAVQDNISVTMPEDSEIVFVAVQTPNTTTNRKFCMWALVETDNDMIKRNFHVVGTGHEVEDEGEFIGSFIDGQFVFHVFELEAEEIDEDDNDDTENEETDTKEETDVEELNL